MKIRQAARYIENSENPIITALGIKFLEASTDKVQAVAKANNKTYTSLRAASNEGMSYKKLKPAIEGATYDTLYSIAGMNVNSFRDKSLKSAIVAYLKAC